MSHRAKILTLSAAALFASCAMGGARVADNPQIAGDLRALTEDLISRWEVLEVHRSGFARIASPSRPDAHQLGFCIRDAIDLGVDTRGELRLAERLKSFLEDNSY